MPSRMGSLSELLGAPLPPPEKLRKVSWLFDIVRLQGSVTLHILGPVLTCTLFASIVAVVHIVYDYHIHLTNQVVPLLSVVVGLILVFRNGTSYDRWYEGSKDWEVMVSAARNFTRQIWISVNVKEPSSNPSTSTTEAYLAEHQSVRESKIRTLNLAIAFLFAVKRHLRGEPGFHHSDFIGLLPADFARFDHETQNRHEHVGSWDSPVNGTSGTTTPHPTRIADVGTAQVAGADTARTPLLKDQTHVVHFHPYDVPNALPLPLIISHEIARALHGYRRKGYLDTVGPSGANTLNGFIQTMVAQMSKMERVLNTPIPASYGIHLKQCVTLYLFTLPFTLVSDLGWFMIPVVTVVSFTLMGIEGIADEIEMPFGYDYYDLPLDRMCNEMKGEIQYIIQRLPEGIEPYDID